MMNNMTFIDGLPYYYSKEDLRAMEVMNQNVARGAAWLDDIDSGWYKKIDISQLDISSGESCICGQVFLDKVNEINIDEDYFCYDNGFEYAHADLLEGDPTAAVLLGFAARDHIRHNDNMNPDIVALNDLVKSPTFKDVYAQFEYLATEWIIHIQKRLANEGEML